MGKRTHRWTPPRTDRTGATRERPPFVRTPTTCRWHDCQVDRAETYFCPHHLSVVLAGIRFANEARAEAEAARATLIAEKIDAGVRLEPGETDHGWIYYAKIDGLIKIGYAKHVASRMRQYPPTTQLLAVEPGTRKLERKRHQYFGKHLAKGREWFHDVPDLTEWVDALVAEYGSAEPHAHTWGRHEAPPAVATKRIRNRRY